MVHSRITYSLTLRLNSVSWCQALFSLHAHQALSSCWNRLPLCHPQCGIATCFRRCCDAQRSCFWAASAAKCWKQDFSSASGIAFRGILESFFTCSISPKRGVQVHIKWSLPRSIVTNDFSCPKTHPTRKARSDRREQKNLRCNWRQWRCQQYIVVPLLIHRWYNVYPHIQLRKQSKGYIVHSFRFHPSLKPESSNSHGFELNRPSIKGTKVMLKVMKAIIIIWMSNLMCPETWDPWGGTGGVRKEGRRNGF